MSPSWVVRLLSSVYLCSMMSGAGENRSGKGRLKILSFFELLADVEVEKLSFWKFAFLMHTMSYFFNAVIILAQKITAGGMQLYWHL